MREISKFPLLTPKDEIALAIRIKAGDETAINWMVSCNLRLVVKIANDYTNLGLPLLDLISEGSMGLMKACRRFNPAKGAKLSTYASWWVKQSIKRALANQSKTIRLPVHIADKLSRVRRAANRMSAELGREPADHELAEELGMKTSKVSMLLLAASGPRSLDETLPDGDDTVGDAISDDNPSAADIVSFEDIRSEMLAAQDVLDDRERWIIVRRFGLDGEKPGTLDDCGNGLGGMGVTRERIRQIQNIALAKLRRAIERRERETVKLPASKPRRLPGLRPRCKLVLIE